MSSKVVVTCELTSVTLTCETERKGSAGPDTQKHLSPTYAREKIPLTKFLPVIVKRSLL